MYPLEMWRNAI